MNYIDIIKELLVKNELIEIIIGYVPVSCGIT